MGVTQRIFEFTLILKNIDENTLCLEDSLYESGCDDALINFRNGTVYLDFSRQADSFESAVMSAIKNVESATIHPMVTSVAPDNFVTESEIANRLNLKRQTISLWIKGERRNEYPFPKPVMKLSERSPFWKWHEVINWLFQNKIISDRELLDKAKFLEDLNAVLEQRDAGASNARKFIFNELKSSASRHSPL